MGRKKAGQAPGTLEYTGHIIGPTKITVLDYNSEYYDQKTFSKPEDLNPYKTSKSNSWINVVGLSDTETIR